MEIIQWSSPNFSERKVDKVDILLLHYTDTLRGEDAAEIFANPDSKVSSHYTVCDDGKIFQHVDESMRAQHSGVGSWGGVEDINSRSIGVEINNPGHSYGYVDFPKKQIGAVINLCRDILSRHKTIPPQHVLGHSDVTPPRKIDPNWRFPWDDLYKSDIGHWVPPTPLSAKGSAMKFGDSGPHVGAFQRMLKIYGYDIDVSGEFELKTLLVVIAFQRHFRPKLCDGVADPSTVETLHRLIKALPAIS